MRTIISVLLANLALGAVMLFAQETGGSTAHPAPTLERINHETQALFESIRPGLVQVQLPIPKWLTSPTDQDNPINKWPLDPDVRAKLQAQEANAAAGQVRTSITPSTQPATQPANQPAHTADHWQMTMVQRPDGSIEFVAPNTAPYDGVIGALVAPRSLGIVYDDRGHIVIPVYIDKETLDDANGALTVFALAGGATKAHFVGSDRQTNLTVLQADQPIGSPAQFHGQRPADGSLVMMLAQGGDGGRLAVWTRTQQDRALVVDVSAHVSGFSRMGQFLDAELARPVIDQLIQFGRVRRATLGVLVSEADAPNGRRAMLVGQVKAGSPAERAGIKDGDYVLSLAGNPVDDLPNFAAAISASNGPTAIVVLRGDKTIELQVALEQK